MRSKIKGVQVDPATIVKDDYHKIDSFAGALDLRAAPENIQPGSAPVVDDVEVTRGDRLVRQGGVTQVESMSRNPKQIILHPGYHYSSSIVMLDPPYVNFWYNSPGTPHPVGWGDAGLPAGRYGSTDFAGVLLLSAGVSGLYYRLPNEIIIHPIPGSPAALGLATFAGRVVLGATTVAGSMDLMGIGWSDATSDYQGWSEDDGAGAEVMIGSMQMADRFQAFAQLGFNLLAIVNRRSIWIAAKTGDVFEPLDIQEKLAGTGTTHADTVRSTEYGPIFLSDDGVRVFDGNSAQSISGPIDAELGNPLESDHYSSSIDPKRKLYHLHTPTKTYTYDLAGKRWWRRQKTYLASVFFPDQGNASPTWQLGSGTWASQAVAWWQLDPQEINGRMYYFKNALIGVEDQTSFTDFGTNLNPRWLDRQPVADNQDMLFTSLCAYITYESDAIATAAIWLPDMKGNYEIAQGFTLPSTAGAADRLQVPFVHTGRGLGLGLVITGGSPRIRRASVRFQPTSVL